MLCELHDIMRVAVILTCCLHLWHTVTAIASTDADSVQASWRKPTLVPRPPFLDTMPLGSPFKPLVIHMMTMPAHGHYMTLRDVGVALAARGHAVSFAMCERNRGVFTKDGLDVIDIGFISAGNCSIYDNYDAVMGELIKNENMDTVQKMLHGVAALALDMCTVLMPKYESMYRNMQDQALPDVLVFDADTFCAMDLSIRYKIPRVSRVGTGPRDVYTNPISIPQYGQALPIAMTTVQRYQNFLSIVFSRLIISPLILPALQASNRKHWQTVQIEPALGTPEYASVSVDAQGRFDDDAPLAEPAVDEDFRVDVPWDGVPTLFNSHWGLEHARALQPYEHMIGHTTNFEGESAVPIPESVLSWLNANPLVPVVYVGMGTLSIIDTQTLTTLADAFSSSSSYRFMWSVPTNQQSLLEPRFRAHSVAWHDQAGHRPQAGSILLVDWVPQLAVLTHNMTAVFLTHGGMNGVAEGTYAQTPMLCLPLFSDQPDNCQHMQSQLYTHPLQDFGFAIRLYKSNLSASIIEESLHQLVTEPSYRANIYVAWCRNVAAGGIPRAVQIVESAAMLGYDGFRHTIPRIYFLPWYEQYNFDIAGITITLLAFTWLCLRTCLRCCCRCCKNKPPRLS